MWTGLKAAVWHCNIFYTSDVQEQQLKLADKLKERREAQQRKLAAQQEKEREQFVKRADKATNPGDVSDVSTQSNGSCILSQIRILILIPILIPFL